MLYWLGEVIFENVIMVREVVFKIILMVREFVFGWGFSVVFCVFFV